MIQVGEDVWVANYMDVVAVGPSREGEWTVIYLKDGRDLTTEWEPMAVCEALQGNRLVYDHDTKAWHE